MRVTLTDAHQQRLRDALKEKTARPVVTTEQRAAIRQICTDAMPGVEPEKLLIAFKSALADAADDAGFAYGVERSALVTALISVFIDELYAAGDGERISSVRMETPATAPRLTLENDSPAARL
jgi:hypothetical protein